MGRQEFGGGGQGSVPASSSNPFSFSLYFFFFFFAWHWMLQVQPTVRPVVYRWAAAANPGAGSPSAALLMFK